MRLAVNAEMEGTVLDWGKVATGEPKTRLTPASPLIE